MQEPTTGSPAPQPPTKHTALGVILGVCIVIIVLMLGALYLWGSTMTPPDPAPAADKAETDAGTETANAEADIEKLNQVSESDQMYAIESDLENTDLDSLEAELSVMERELE